MTSSSITKKQVVDMILKDEYNDLSEQDIMLHDDIVNEIVEDWEWFVELHHVDDNDDADIVLSAFFNAYNQKTTGCRSFSEYVDSKKK